MIEIIPDEREINMRTRRKYTYRNSGFADMRDREREKAKELEKQKTYKTYPWKAYATC